jgi:putative tricarboxylic transport membrane protein
MMVNLRDQLSGFFWLGISVFVCVESYQSDIGRFQSPGPGFFPFWGGIALGTFALLLLAKTWLEKREGIKLLDLWKGKEWDKVILVLTSLLIYAILLPRLGYLLTTLGLMSLLFCVKGRQRLLIQGVSALITVLASYIVFYVWLKVPLPRGILGF